MDFMFTPAFCSFLVHKGEMEKLRADLHEQDTQLREDNAGTD
jgi:hypothetical protein